MRKSKNENFEQWIKVAQEYEKSLAENKLKQGRDPNLVMEEFAQRLMKKILHPIHEKIREEIKFNTDHIRDKKNYEENYLKKRSLVADQIDGNLFDNSKEK